MGKKNMTHVLVGVFFCVMLSSMIAPALAEEIILVCHKENPVESLSPKEVRNIFLGKEIEWEHQEKIVLAVLKIKALHQTFLKEYIGMTSAKYRMYWKQMVFTGKTSGSPEMLSSEEDLLEYVAQTEGAIGYVSADANTDNVKVLTEKSE